jgi:recombination DNA repair RAD52 pathway protein
MTGILTDEQVDLLLKDLHPSRVSQRTQGGATLSYVEAYDVKATLIRVFGFGGFSAEVTEAKVLSITDTEKGGRTQYTVLATSTVRLTIHALNAVYAETAAASQVGNQVGEVTDFAIKTASSDALKRCAIYLGTQFGLSLYADGSRKDVVKAIFAPDQRREYTPPTPPSPEVQKMLDRATTVEAVGS